MQIKTAFSEFFVAKLEIEVTKISLPSEAESNQGNATKCNKQATYWKTYDYSPRSGVYTFNLHETIHKSYFFSKTTPHEELFVLRNVPFDHLLQFKYKIQEPNSTVLQAKVAHNSDPC